MRRNRTDYAINRYYSPDTGRFTSHDPLTELDRPERLNQPQGLNLYPYVMGGPTRYTDPDGLEWMYKDREFFWSEANRETDALRQIGWRSVEDGEIFTLDNKRTVYLADKWSSKFDGAFLNVTLPQPSDYDFILPNKRTGDPERFEGVPDHAQFGKWTHYLNGEFYGSFSFTQFSWTEAHNFSKDEKWSIDRVGPALEPTKARAIPKWQRYSWQAAMAAGAFNVVRGFHGALESAEGLDTTQGKILKDAQIDQPLAFGTGEVGTIVAGVAVAPGAVGNEGLIGLGGLTKAGTRLSAAEAGTVTRLAASEGAGGSTTRLWRAVEPEELADVIQFGDYNIHPNSTFKRFAFDEGSLDEFIKANPGRDYTKTFIDVPTENLGQMYRHADPGGVGKAIGIDVFENPQFYDWFQLVNILPK